MESRLYKARRAAGMTQGAAASIIGVSMPTYIDREKNPASLTFRQFLSLAAEMDDDAKGIMAATLDDVETASGEWKPLMELTLGEYYAARKNLDELEKQLSQEVNRVFA